MCYTVPYKIILGKQAVLWSMDICFIWLSAFSGSILFGRMIPLVFKSVDVTRESDDGNPGVLMRLSAAEPAADFWLYYQIF